MLVTQGKRVQPWVEFIPSRAVLHCYSTGKHHLARKVPFVKKTRNQELGTRNRDFLGNRFPGPHYYRHTSEKQSSYNELLLSEGLLRRVTRTQWVSYHCMTAKRMTAWNSECVAFHKASNCMTIVWQLSEELLRRLTILLFLLPETPIPNIVARLGFGRRIFKIDWLWSETWF